MTDSKNSKRVLTPEQKRKMKEAMLKKKAEKQAALDKLLAGKSKAEQDEIKLRAKREALTKQLKKSQMRLDRITGAESKRKELNRLKVRLGTMIMTRWHLIENKALIGEIKKAADKLNEDTKAAQSFKDDVIAALKIISDDMQTANKDKPKEQQKPQGHEQHRGH